MSEYTALQWLARSALGGGLVLLVAWWGMRRVESPARRQRLGEGGLVAALLVAVLSLAPGWISVRLPALSLAVPPDSPPSDFPLADTGPGEEREGEGWFDLLGLEQPATPGPDPAGREDGPLVAAAPPPPSAWRPDWAGLGRLVVAGYALGAGGMLVWWLGGHGVLWWWLRRVVPASPRLERLWAEMSAGRPVRLVVSPRVHMPFGCGLWRPTVVLPASLAGSAEEAALRWVLGHELAHLERRDPFSALLFGLGQGFFYFLPWFWKLRHEVRLCQEYLADRAAVAAGGDRLDYADFLVGWARTSGLPAHAAAGASASMLGQRTDLFRRVNMLLQDRTSLEPRCPRRWLLLPMIGLLSLAVVFAGVGPASADDNKAPDKGVTKKDEKKDQAPPAKPDGDDRKPKDKVKPGPGFPNIDDLMKRLPAGLDDGQSKMIRQQLEQARRQMEQALLMAERMRSGLGRRWERGGPHEGRLGVRVAAPSPILAAQLDLPRGEGAVIEQVMPDSAAARAGLKANDVLLELAGKAVPADPARLVRLVAGLPADKKIDAVVMRKGKKETIKGLTLSEAPAVDRPRLTGAGRFGRLVNGGSMLTLQRNGDQFVVIQREGGQTITARGKLVEGKARPSEIIIVQGRGPGQTYGSLDKVPEAQRDQVKSLLEMSEKGVVKSKSKP